MNQELFKCLDCSKEYLWNDIKDLDYCPNCENIWLKGESNRYGKLLGIKKKCNLCHDEKDLINFRVVYNYGKPSRQNECRQCHVNIRRKLNNCKFHKRPHFYLVNENIIILKINNFCITIDAEDYSKVTGYSWSIYKRKRNKTEYAVAKDANGNRIYIHQLIMNDNPDNKLIDHKNHNGLDNRKENLRFANNSQNLANSVKRLNNTSGYKGVYQKRDTGKWIARITCNSKTRIIGQFLNPVEAAKAYDIKALELFGEFAVTNFPLSNYSNVAF